MAKITEEMKIQINELYCQLGVKAQVARELGISAASVSKYIVPGYVPKAERVEITCDVELQGIDEFIDNVFNSGFNDSIAANFEYFTQLTKPEKKALEELRKEIFI